MAVHTPGSESYDFAESLAKEKVFSSMTVDDIETIVHESRGIS